MFAVSNLLTALAEVLNVLFQAAEIVILIRVVLSWANADPYNGLVKTIYVISEPMLAPFRKIIPPWKLSGVDLSPVFAVLIIFFLRSFLIPTLYDAASHLR